jgi:hypothetical protein
VGSSRRAAHSELFNRFDESPFSITEARSLDKLVFGSLDYAACDAVKIKTSLTFQRFRESLLVET